MTPQRVRELCARSEDQDLDFKLIFYAAGDAGNNELAKDIMAVANSLHVAAEPGHILIGVRELQDGTGEIVGVSEADLPDDADVHQRVEHRLNAIPTFKLHRLQVDGVWVGVIEIRPGGRPFFPLRDRSPLRRFAALYRSGTRTTEASPTQIIEWATVDRRANAEAERLGILQLRSQLEAFPAMWGGGTTGNASRFNAACLLRNAGTTQFEVSSLTAVRRLSAECQKELAEHPQAAEIAPLIGRERTCKDVACETRYLLAGQQVSVGVAVELDDDERSLLSLLDNPRRRALLDAGPRTDMLEVEFRLVAKSPVGLLAELRHVVTWPGK